MEAEPPQLEQQVNMQYYVAGESGIKCHPLPTNTPGMKSTDMPQYTQNILLA